ncbi:hypothetical protein OGAPHI_000135 [Ogataea philodendri]|uniref:Uncharacterized protein n=1 Tax=Ogataea philodendri TaxID=1378263 RepID=A0A9P8PIF2_9ASCO|nr:uncharacterized protein OGAPHI_000135 [Ogataea philodendri]KAH3671949.1 hypothetical protein OGAPHI_000135 [Ogataea philodendri]
MVAHIKLFDTASNSDLVDHVGESCVGDMETAGNVDDVWTRTDEIRDLDQTTIVKIPFPWKSIGGRTGFAKLSTGSNVVTDSVEIPGVYAGELIEYSESRSLFCPVQAMFLNVGLWSWSEMSMDDTILSCGVIFVDCMRSPKESLLFSRSPAVIFISSETAGYLLHRYSKTFPLTIILKSLISTLSARSWNTSFGRDWNSGKLLRNSLTEMELSIFPNGADATCPIYALFVSNGLVFENNGIAVSVVGGRDGPGT